MSISNEVILHLAELSDLKISDNEIEKYKKDISEILKLANEVNNVNTDGMDETIGANQKCNAFRKDEVKNFGDREILMQNAPSEEDGMFKIPKMSL